MSISIGFVSTIQCIKVSNKETLFITRNAFKVLNGFDVQKTAQSHMVNIVYFEFNTPPQHPCDIVRVVRSFVFYLGAYALHLADNVGIFRLH